MKKIFMWRKRGLKLLKITDIGIRLNQTLDPWVSFFKIVDRQFLKGRFDDNLFFCVDNTFNQFPRRYSLQRPVHPLHLLLEFPLVNQLYQSLIVYLRFMVIYVSIIRNQLWQITETVCQFARGWSLSDWDSRWISAEWPITRNQFWTFESHEVL